MNRLSNMQKLLQLQSKHLQSGQCTKKTRKKQPQKPKPKTGADQHATQQHTDQGTRHSITNCNNCGGNHEAKREKCLAYGRQCAKSGIISRNAANHTHYKKRSVNQVETIHTPSSDEEFFYVAGVQTTTRTVSAVDNSRTPVQ